MKYDVIIVGAGPAGLGAATAAAAGGAKTLLVDENTRPGGQLFKQIHKFFGSGEHYAGVRGVAIGEELLNEAQRLGVQVLLGTRVWGFDENGGVLAVREEETLRLTGRQIILATGAGENALSFPGCTLPGVMTAGAAQTLTNLYRVLPGEKIVMVGSGNVGLIVSYQLLQAGARVQAIVEASGAPNGYGVHVNKVKRAGVPLYLGYTVKKALGEDKVEGVIIAKADSCFQPVPGTELVLEADTICLAVGLTPRAELAVVGGCGTCYSKTLGGVVPLHDGAMRTTRKNILIAGDLSGVEEASTALDEGRLAALTALRNLGLLEETAYTEQACGVQKRLAGLRSGPFGGKRQAAKEEILRAYALRK